MRERIKTPRLILRPFAEEDVVAAFTWFGDPEVMRYSPTGPDRDIEDTRKRLPMYRTHQAAHGFSKWIIQERASGELIGDAGLLVLEDLGKIDLGFRFAKPYWGQGFATEVASAWIHIAFDDFHLGCLTAFAHPQNVASLRVLQKVGFRQTGLEPVMGMEAITFALDRTEYELMGE